MNTLEEKNLLGHDSLSVSSRCHTCHEAPPQDANHLFHFEVAPSVSIFEGKMTCYDCHGGVIQADTVKVLDSIYRTPFGSEISGSNLPEEFRMGPPIRVDTLLDEMPLSFTEDYLEKTLIDFLTNGTHNDGKVDVKMHKRGGSLEPKYDPQKFTCSAVACHTSSEPYPFLIDTLFDSVSVP